MNRLLWTTLAAAWALALPAAASTLFQPRLVSAEEEAGTETPETSTRPSKAGKSDPEAGAHTNALHFASIEAWAGTGANRAALVIDWHDGTVPHALAWGYRWDGQATSLDMWNAVTNAHPELSGIVTNDGGVLRLAAVNYKRPSRPGDIVPRTGRHDVYRTAYAWDHTGHTARAGAWTHWVGDGQACYRPELLTVYAGGLHSRVLTNNAWDAWSRDADSPTRAPGFAAAALNYPFASEVRAYAFGDGDIPWDWISGDLFTDPSTALGRPTVDTTGDAGTVPLGNPVPVVPVYGPLRAYELVSVGENGYLELAFDHPVLDHPDNPYGADFIVYGNSAQVIGSQQQWNNGDPNDFGNAGGCSSEPAEVLVSQDGANWIAFTNGPYGDSFAPTLGRVYDPGRVETNLGPWNLWWGGATDATLPVDPAMAASEWQDLNLAEIARRYRGGAGGTPFDIAELDLAPHPQSGLKWFRFIRFEPRDASSTPEIDAVADVSPALPQNQWRTRHFSWVDDPDAESDAADPDADGMPNLMEYGLGRDPTNGPSAPAFAVALCSTTTPQRLLVHYTVSTAARDVEVRVLRTDNLPQPHWTTDGVHWAPAGPASNGIAPMTAQAPIASGQTFIMLRTRQDE